MNILDEIIAYKRVQVAERKSTVPLKTLERAEFFERQAISLSEYIRRKDKTGIIAEFKRRSPSKGEINANASVADTTRAYSEAGASGLSVLTDERFFGGSSEDLSTARNSNSCPILRKDFMIDEYQVFEAKAIGADVILLIAAALDPVESKKLARVAHSLGLEVLLEVHSEEELKANLAVDADLIGVNNRNLKTFEVSLDTSRKLSTLIPNGVVKVSESGISKPEAIVELQKYGYEGFLIGENFMKEQNPGVAAAAFVRRLNELTSGNC